MFWQKKTSYFTDSSTKKSGLFISRVLQLCVGMVILITVLLLHIYNLQIKNYELYATKSDNNRIKVAPKLPIRGNIYDRNNKLLASSQVALGLYILPERITAKKETEKVFDHLKNVVNLTDEEIADFYKNKNTKTKYVPLLLKGDLTDEQVARFAVNKYLFPNIEIQPYYTRVYPYKKIVSHLIGYVSKINEKDMEELKREDKIGNYVGDVNIGKSGIEKYYEEDLHGYQGYTQVEVNNKGSFIDTLYAKEATNGKGLKLTIDVDLQEYIYELLGDRIGSAVVLDATDGSVLAMVSNPSYDNNLFVNGISSKDYSNLLNDADHPLYNRAVQSNYPPGSLVKPFVSVAALEEGVITPTQLINSPGSWTMPNTTQKYRDTKKSGHGLISLVKAIAESADTYYYQVAYQLGIDKLSAWMKKFGFGEKTGVDLKEGSTGIMPSREWKEQRYKKSWLLGDTISVGIGQGYWATTPLHLAKAFSILINNGKMIIPHLLESKFDKLVEPYQDFNINENIRVRNPKTWSVVKAGMRDVIAKPYGTGFYTFQGSKYQIAGKSGTAQVFSLKGAEYNKNKLSKKLHDHSWFFGYAPYDNPKIVVVVILENEGFGAQASGPVVRKIIDYYLGGKQVDVPMLDGVDIRSPNKKTDFRDNNEAIQSTRIEDDIDNGPEETQDNETEDIQGNATENIQGNETKDVQNNEITNKAIEQSIVPENYLDNKTIKEKKKKRKKRNNKFINKNI